MTSRSFKHICTNPSTGEDDYFFPLEITDQSIRVLARERGLEVCRTRLGSRSITAVMVPCKDTATINGQEVFLDTPSEVQRQHYLDLIKEELAAQDAARQDGRCQIPNGRGGVKRCPCRTPNPNFVPGGSEPKTLPVRCEGCVYEQYRQSHTVIELSSLDHENEGGEMESYEVPAPRSNFAADRYEEIRKQFLDFVRERNAKLLPLAEMLTDEFTKSEASRELDLATSTVGSRTDKLKGLVTEFLDNLITL